MTIIIRKNIQCFNCDKYGNYAPGCWLGKEKQTKIEEELNMAQEDSNWYHVISMLTIINSVDYNHY